MTKLRSGQGGGPSLSAGAVRCTCSDPLSIAEGTGQRPIVDRADTLCQICSRLSYRKREQAAILLLPSCGARHGRAQRFRQTRGASRSPGGAHPLVIDQQADEHRAVAQAEQPTNCLAKMSASSSRTTSRSRNQSHTGGMSCLPGRNRQRSFRCAGGGQQTDVNTRVERRGGHMPARRSALCRDMLNQRTKQQGFSSSFSAPAHRPGRLLPSIPHRGVTRADRAHASAQAGPGPV